MCRFYSPANCSALMPKSSFPNNIYSNFRVVEVTCLGRDVVKSSCPNKSSSRRHAWRPNGEWTPPKPTFPLAHPSSEDPSAHRLFLIHRRPLTNADPAVIHQARPATEVANRSASLTGTGGQQGSAMSKGKRATGSGG